MGSLQGSFTGSCYRAEKDIQGCTNVFWGFYGFGFRVFGFQASGF